MKWRLYDELIKKKLLEKIGVPPPAIRSEAQRSETGALPTGALRVEEI
jgi:hypothetical protein